MIMLRIGICIYRYGSQQSSNNSKDTNIDGVTSTTTTVLLSIIVDLLSMCWLTPDRELVKVGCTYCTVYRSVDWRIRILTLIFWIVSMFQWKSRREKDERAWHGMDWQSSENNIRACSFFFGLVHVHVHVYTYTYTYDMWIQFQFEINFNFNFNRILDS